MTDDILLTSCDFCGTVEPSWSHEERYKPDGWEYVDIAFQGLLARQVMNIGEIR